MSTPLVSVIMPVYNSAPYLRESITSLLRQRLVAWELIAVDDGSCDDSYQILQSYCQRDHRIRVYSLPKGSPGGEGYPVNRALEQARGEFIARLDADDWLESDALSNLTVASRQSKADIAVGRYQLVLADGSYQTDHEQTTWERLWKNSQQGLMQPPFADLPLSLGPIACRNLYRREFLQRHGLAYPEDNYRSQDHGFHWLCWAYAQRAILVNTCVFNYRQGVDGQLTDAKVETLIESYSMVMDWVVEQFKQRGLLEKYGLLVLLDNLRQITGLARHQPLADAYLSLRRLSSSIQRPDLQHRGPSTLPPPRHLKLYYWRWLRFCLQRPHPLLLLVDSRLNRSLFQLRKAWQQRQNSKRSSW